MTQDVCRIAHANIAAVNYHFGGKKELSRAVWDWALERAVREEHRGHPVRVREVERLRGKRSHLLNGRRSEDDQTQVAVTEKWREDPAGIFVERYALLREQFDYKHYQKSTSYWWNDPLCLGNQPVEGA